MKRFLGAIAPFLLALVVHAPAQAQFNFPGFPGFPTFPTSTGPAGQFAGAYTLRFADEFNGSSLDRQKWNDHPWYETSNSTINYAVNGGSLKVWPMRDANGNFFNRTFDTDGRFNQRYGFFEIEARLPIGKGPWPAFWLFNHIGDRRPEIDVMEGYPGGGPSSGWSNSALHPTAYGIAIWRDADMLLGSKMVLTTDLSAGFHKYGVKWEPNRLTFYFDGREVYRLAATMNDPLYVVLSLWFGSASGTPDASTPQGSSNAYEINYVRVWQFR